MVYLFHQRQYSIDIYKKDNVDIYIYPNIYTANERQVPYNSKVVIPQ